MAWQKSLFEFFCTILLKKKKNEILGQPSITIDHLIPLFLDANAAFNIFL